MVLHRRRRAVGVADLCARAYGASSHRRDAGWRQKGLLSASTRDSSAPSIHWSRLSRPAGSACRARTSGKRMPRGFLWRDGAEDLEALWRGGLEDLETGPLVVETTYADFDDLWKPLTLGVGPAGSYTTSLDSSGKRPYAMGSSSGSRCPPGRSR